MSLLDAIRGSDDTPAVTAEIDPGDVFDLLAAWRRRHVIAIVDDLDAGATIDHGRLAECIAFIENDHDAIGHVTGDERKRVYICLYQVHLPKLDEAGVVDWDKRGGAVAATPLTGPVAEAMQQVENAVGDASAGQGAPA